MGTVCKDTVLGTSLVLSIVSLVLLFGVTLHFQSSLNILQNQVKHDRELLWQLQDQLKVAIFLLLFCTFPSTFPFT